MPDALEAIAEAARQRRAMPELIRRARAEGRTWEQIAEAAQMSRAGVIKASKA